MNQITQSSRMSPEQLASVIHTPATLDELVRAQCVRHGINSTLSKACLMIKMSISARGAVYVVDDQNRRIPLAFDLLMQAPPATGMALMAELADLLTQIEISAQATTNWRRLNFMAKREMDAEALRQAKASVKVAIAKVARRTRLRAQLDVLEAQKPKPEDYGDFLSKLVSHEKQAAGLEVAIEQAKAEGDTARAKVLSAELREMLANPPRSYETETERWRAKYDPVATQHALFDGADEELGRIEAELAELLGARAREREPSEPKLLYRNTPIPAVLKALGSGWPVGMAMYDADVLPRMLVKHAAAVAYACDVGMTPWHPARRRVHLGLVGMATPGAIKREVKALTQSATALASLHVVADSPEAASDQIGQPIDLESLARFDQSVVEMAVANTFAMMRDDFMPTEIMLSREAATMLANERAKLHAYRTRQDLHPVYDAYLARMPYVLCQVAGLLHLWRNGQGSLTAETMQIAIDLCLTLAREFERSVVPAPEMSENERLAWALRRALYGHVDQQMKADAPKPFRVALSTLCNKAGRIGLSRGQVRRAAFTMHDLGWVRIVPDGLDQMVGMDPHLFGQTSRQ
jgi:hypothetical protein